VLAEEGCVLKGMAGSVAGGEVESLISSEKLKRAMRAWKEQSQPRA
jgi:hypothetical protein